MDMNNIFSPYLTEDDFVVLVRRQVSIFGGIRPCARNFNVYPADISHLLDRTRAPSPSLIKNLGFRKVVYYVRKER